MKLHRLSGTIPTIGALAAAFLLVWLLPTPPALRGIANYLPIHMALEGFSIVVAMLVFAVAWNAYSSERPGNVLILACAMLAVGLIDFVHMLSFKGMPDLITPSGPEKAINFWLAARFLAALALLAAALRPWTPLPAPRWRHVLLIAGLAYTAIITWAGLFHQEALPHTFVEGQGLTPLKIAAEYCIVALLIVPAAVFYRDARRGATYDAAGLFAAAAVSILSELAFTLYKDVSDVFNLLGHVYKAVAYMYIYHALFVASLRQPFEMLQQQVALRRSAEEEARSASRYARSLIEASLDPLVTISPAGKITDVNAATVAATGVARENLIGTDFSDYFTEPQNARSGYRKAFENGFVTDFPLTMRHRNGRLTDVLYNASVYRDQTGGVQGIFAAARDVTERKRAETNLRRLAAIVESSDDAIISATLDGLIATWNAGADRLYGYRAEEIVGHPILTLVPADRMNEERGILERVRAGEHVNHYATVRLRKDGTPIDVSLAVAPVRDDAGTIVGISKAARDITEARRAEAKLQAASRYARSLIEASLDPLVTISSEGKITDVNAATVAATGVAREDLIGTDFSDYFTEPQEARSGYRKAFENGFVTDYPLTIRHEDGRLTDVLYNASVYRDETGSVQGIFAAARDVTERKRAERALQQLNRDLEQRIAERTAQLEAANRELEAFAYSASHDLRAPLQTIEGFSRALEEDYGGKLDAQALDYLRRIRAAAKHMAQLTDALLQLSRLARSDMTLETADLSAIARAVADELRAREPARAVDFDIAAGATAHADTRLLGAVLDNLLSNAWKFTSRHQRARIEFGVTERAGERVFHVRDDGAGFAMERAQKLFAPFQRLHATSDFPGNGIGLALVRRIIQRHGGRIWAESAPEKGAAFYFTLPAARSEAPVSA